MKEFFYGTAKWQRVLIIVTVVIFIIGLGGYLFLG